jgi:hypothetical protein
MALELVATWADHRPVDIDNAAWIIIQRAL